MGDLQAIQRERMTEGLVRDLDAAGVVEWIHSLQDREAELEAEVERLTARLGEAVSVADHHAAQSLAAQRQVERLRDTLTRTAAHLAAAIDLLERGGKKAAPSDKMFGIMLTDYHKALAAARAALAGEGGEH